MASDREVLREIWEGRIPVCFQLASEEVFTLTAPDPIYRMVPRLTYFPLATDKVRKHFARNVSPEKQESEMWLEFEGAPIKWHYPVGLLYDLWCTSRTLPWTLTVHFEKFPEHDLIHCPNREMVESQLMSFVKEADALKHRGQVMSNMLKKDHNQLWAGLLNDKFDQFWAVNGKLMESGEDGFKYIPYRLYAGECGTPSQRQMPFIQRLIRPFYGTDVTYPTTLKDLLNDAVPELVSKVKVLTHGVELLPETPLQWMSEHLSYADNFLHLVLVSCEQQPQEQILQKQISQPQQQQPQPKLQSQKLTHPPPPLQEQQQPSPSLQKQVSQPQQPASLLQKQTPQPPPQQKAPLQEPETPQKELQPPIQPQQPQTEPQEQSNETPLPQQQEQKEPEQPKQQEHEQSSSEPQEPPPSQQDIPSAEQLPQHEQSDKSSPPSTTVDPVTTEEGR